MCLGVLAGVNVHVVTQQLTYILLQRVCMALVFLLASVSVRVVTQQLTYILLQGVCMALVFLLVSASVRVVTQTSTPRNIMEATEYL